MSRLTWFSQAIEFPAGHEPEWRDKVERWYQLDAAAYTLTETFWRLRAKLTARPEWLLLASPQASNLTDAQFAASLSPSPAKFVHTLPNIRSASVLQVMEWSGKVLCLQNDPRTVLTAISEGMQWVEDGEVWILSVTGAGTRYTGHIFTLSQHGTLKVQECAQPARAGDPPRDMDLFHWLNSSEQDVRHFVADGFEILNSR